MPQRTTKDLILITAGLLFLFHNSGELLGQTVLPKDQDRLPFASNFDTVCSKKMPATPAAAPLNVSENGPTLVSAWINLNYPDTNQLPAATVDTVTLTDADEPLRVAKFHSDVVQSENNVRAPEILHRTGYSAVSSTSQSSTNDYCERMAKLLASSLHGSNVDQAIQEQAIESTLRLITENVAATAEARNQAKIAQLQTQHVGQLLQLNAEHLRQLLQLHRQPVTGTATDGDFNHAVSLWNQRLESVYENLSRNNQQLEILSRNNANLERTLAALEKKITPATETTPQVIRNQMYVNPPSNPIFQRPTAAQPLPKNANTETFTDAVYNAYSNTPLDSRSSVAQSNQLREQISELTQRLQQLERSDPDVRRTGYLEPVYNTTQTLKPLSLAPNRAPLMPAESSQLPSNQYRRQTNPNHNAND
jgi:prefoldin subunit 5